ncbi:MAG: hypothetical protein IK055_10240 [Lachnospiraceae bacterium]|nr:hypothetical protein [Lachnospiraceae bacterium]
MFVKIRRGKRCAAWIAVLAMMVALLAACGSKDPEERDPKAGDKEVTATPEPTKEPGGDVTPTAEPTPADTTPTPEATPTTEVTPEATPTAEVTPEATPTAEATPTETPTPEATPTPTEVPAPTGYPTATPTPAAAFGTHMNDYIGTWYAKCVQGLESDLSECKDDPNSDYRLEFVNDEYDTARLIHAYEHNTENTEAWEWTYEYELRTQFSEAEMKKYRDLGYGMEEIAKNPTDFSKGHLLYTCVEGPHDDEDYGMFLIVDAKQDGSLEVEFAGVYSGGSFPVFTDYVFVRERVYEVGNYFEDYVGMWYAHENYNWGDGKTETYPHNDGSWDFSEDYYRIYISPYGQLEMAFGKDPSDEKTSYILYWTLPEEWVKRFRNYPSFPEGLQTNLNDKTLVFASLDGYVLVVARMLNDTTLHLTIDAGEYPYELTLTREHAYDYDCASIFMDYVGYYELSEHVVDGAIVKVTDPTPYVEIRITRDGILTEMYSGSLVDYTLRTKENATNDPAWYAEHGLDKLYTNKDEQLWVFRSTSTDFNKDAIIVVRMVADGELLIASYSVNNGTYYESTYAKYTRESGERK